MKIAALLILPLALLSANTHAAEPNMIRNGDFEDEALDGWQPGENVSIEATTEKVHSGNRAIKLAWHDVTEMPWGRGGNLCWAREIITRNLKEDTRYRVKCSVLVDEFPFAQHGGISRPLRKRLSWSTSARRAGADHAKRPDLECQEQA